MGAPESSTNTAEDEVRATQNIALPAPIITDDSDNEMADPYEGYQPLSMADDEVDDIVEDAAVIEQEMQAGDCNLPQMVSADVQLEREVWSVPRPQELQIELDDAKTEQIRNAMAKINLPNANIPAWAAGVPEEDWKEQLLQRIRQRNETHLQAK